MSGRKRSEVTSVLRNADMTRKELFDRYGSRIKGMIRDMENASNGMGAGFPAPPRFDPVVDQYFPEQKDRILAEFGRLSADGKRVETDISSEKRELGSILDRVSSVDRSVQSLSGRIAGKSGGHYFNDEYREAETLLKRYGAEREALSSLQVRVLSKHNRIVTGGRAAAAARDRASALVKEAGTLNDMAGRRKDQDDAKAMIESARSLFSGISADLAKKFASAEYRELCGRQSEFENAGTAVLTLNQDHISHIEKVSSLVSRRHQEFEKRKREARTAMESVKAFLDGMTYSDPLSPDKQLSAETFCGAVLNDPSLFAAIADNIALMDNLYNTERFPEAKDTADVVLKSLQGLSDRLDERQIRIKEQIQTALAIEDVLLEMGYDDISTDFPDGHISGGIRISTQIPDTITLNLNSENPADGDGESGEKIDIQFEMSESGCKDSALSLASRLGRMGIPFRITDWGAAQPDHEQRRTPKSKTNRERQR